MPNFKVALVGVGQRGLQHLQALCDLQEEELVTIVALVDPFVENLAKEKITSFVKRFLISKVCKLSILYRLSYYLDLLV